MKNIFKEEKIMLQFKFNPGLKLTNFGTTQPWWMKVNCDAAQLKLGATWLVRLVEICYANLVVRLFSTWLVRLVEGSVGFCRESRVEGRISRVEGRGSRVEGRGSPEGRGSRVKVQVILKNILIISYPL